MKQRILAAVLTILILSACAAAAGNPEEGEAGGEPAFRGHSEAAEEPPAFDRYAGGDLFLEIELKDGECYTLPSLTEEERALVRQSADYLPLLQAYLEAGGVYLTPSRYVYLFPDAQSAFRPVTVGRYGRFEFIFLAFPGYRGSTNGDFYLFENALFKGCIRSVGTVDFGDCFRELGDRIWFVAAKQTGGSGFSVIYKEWISLNGDQLPTEFFYTEYYGTGNFSYGLGIDYPIDFYYEAAEDALFFDSSGVPRLKIRWTKTVDAATGIVVLTNSGEEEYTLQGFGYGDSFDPYEPGERDFIDGMEEQLGALLRGGTEEERQIAELLIEHFSAE